MSKSKVQRYFDNIAPIYDYYKKKNSFYYNTLKQGIRENIGKERARNILDIGCGTGEILNFLNSKKGLGVDISSQMIQKACTKFKSKKSLKFMVFDIEKNPLKGNFDYILLIDVIEHLTNPQKAIQNIAYSMSLETKLILGMINPFWEPILMVLEKLRLKMPEGVHHRISERELIDIFNRNNLKILAKKTYLPSSRFNFINNLSLIFMYQVIKK